MVTQSVVGWCTSAGGLAFSPPPVDEAMSIWRITRHLDPIQLPTYFATFREEAPGIRSYGASSMEWRLWAAFGAFGAARIWVVRGVMKEDGISGPAL